MQHFADISLPELSSVLGIFIGMLTGFYALVRFMLSQSATASDADRTERQELSKAIDGMADGMRKVAESNKRIADESEKRNGHLAEITVQSRDQVLSAIGNIKEQHVETQVVNNETVLNKE